MKKKLLSIFLSLAMVFTLIPMTTGVAFAGDEQNKTIDDILPKGFPVSNSKNSEGVARPPINAWIKADASGQPNDTGQYIYLVDGYLCIYSPLKGGNYTSSTEKISNISLKASKNGYTPNDISVTNYYPNGIVFDFIMDGNSLTSIIISGDFKGNPIGSLNGTYVAPNLPNKIADILPSNFPTTEQKGWTNQNNGTTLYLSDDNLCCSTGSFKVSTATNVLFDGSNFEAQDLDCTLSFAADLIRDESNPDGTLKLQLTKIEITGYNQAHSSTNVDGTYIAPKTLDKIFPSCDMWANEKGVILYRNSDDLECLDQEGTLLTSFRNIFNETVTLVFGKEYQYELTTDGISFQFKLNDAGKVTNVIINGFNGDNAVLNGTYSAPLTVADILPEDFPKSISLDNIPSASWKNADDVPLFYLEEEYGKGLYFGKTEYPYVWCEIDQVLIKTENGYYTYDTNRVFTLTFNMDGDELYCVEVSFIEPEYESCQELSDYRIFKGIYSSPATVSFNVNNLGNAPAEQTVKRGLLVVQPENPTADGYTFGGWYSDEKCTKAWNFAVDTVKGNMTLYAKWIKNDVPKIAVRGNVTESESNVPGATVELFLGMDRVAATVTDDTGCYSFNDVENGTYNIVVTKADDGKTKTELVTVNNENATVNVVLPSGNVNSIVEHKGTEVEGVKSNITQTVVGGLDAIAERESPSGDQKITIKLKVEPKADDNTEAQQEIKGKAGEDKKVEFIDMSLLKQVNNGVETPIGDGNTTLLTIVIPFDFTTTDVNSVMILRKHGEGNAEALARNPGEGQEGFKVDEAAGTITIYATKFSEYAIAYNDSGSQPTPPAPVTEYTVKYDLQGHGDAIADVVATGGSKLAAPTAPVAAGWTFGGWFKEAECINAWNFDNDTVNANMTLYAKWTKVVEPEKVSVLLLKGATSGSKAVKLSWNKVDGATKYVVYGNSCGKTSKKLKTVKNNKFTVKKIAGKKLAAHKTYKFYVVAYDAVGNKTKSKTIHFIAANTKGKYANVKSIKAKKTSLQLAVGKFGQVGATYKMYSGKKHLGTNHGKALRYISDCPEVVSVSSNGKILARQAGTATIYIQDMGGKYCTTTVTVQ